MKVYTIAEEIPLVEKLRFAVVAKTKGDEEEDNEIICLTCGCVLANKIAEMMNNWKEVKRYEYNAIPVTVIEEEEGDF